VSGQLHIAANIKTNFREVGLMMQIVRRQDPVATFRDDVLSTA
jgi:hypothetical protein